MKTDPILEEDILQAAKAIYRPELNAPASSLPVQPV